MNLANFLSFIEFSKTGSGNLLKEIVSLCWYFINELVRSITLTAIIQVLAFSVVQIYKPKTKMADRFLKSGNLRKICRAVWIWVSVYSFVSIFSFLILSGIIWKMRQKLQRSQSLQIQNISIIRSKVMKISWLMSRCNAKVTRMI